MSIDEMISEVRAASAALLVLSVELRVHGDWVSDEIVDQVNRINAALNGESE